jgi:excisionase family DNA binding protein
MSQDTRHDDAYLTTGDAAKLADRSVETIRMWERAGRLPAIRTSSGQRLFRRDDVLEAARSVQRRRAE